MYIPATIIVKPSNLVPVLDATLIQIVTEIIHGIYK